ncbi:phospholipase A2 inhibitor NAI-like [Lithobates pipiens]
MSSLLGYLCVLSAFTATGYSLTCKLCLGQDSSSCVGTTETCSPDHACGAVRTVTKINENEMDLYFISCVALKECNSPGSISVPNGKIRRGTSCCYTSNCIPPAPQLPADDKEANGLFCGTCVTESSTDCSPEGIMECTGKEDMCLFQTTLTTGLLNTKEALRGCSTKSYCNLAKQSVKSDQMNVELTYSCTPGGNHTTITPTDQDNAGNSHIAHSPSATLISILLLFLLCGKW